MASLIDILGLSAGAIGGAMTARDERRTAERAAQQQTLLDELKRKQEDEDRQQRNRLTEAQIRSYESGANARRDPAMETFGVPIEAVDEQGNPVLLERGNRGTLRPVEGYRPRPRAEASTEPKPPVRGTPEYLRAIREEEETRQEVSGITQTERGRQEEVLTAGRDMENALANLEAQIANGIDVMPGPRRSSIESTYAIVQLQIKELARLGVLAGPDMGLIENILTPPTGMWLQAQRALGVKPEDVIKAQIAQVRQLIRDKQRNRTTQSASPPPTGPTETTSTGRTFRVAPQ